MLLLVQQLFSWSTCCFFRQTTLPSVCCFFLLLGAVHVDVEIAVVLLGDQDGGTLTGVRHVGVVALGCIKYR